MTRDASHPAPGPSGLPVGRTALAALGLALLTASGMLPGTMVAVIVAVARAGYGFSAGQAGLLAGADIAGAAAGALLSVLVPVPARWRRQAAAVLAALVLIDLISVAAADFPALLGLRLLRGLVGGRLMAIGYAAIARTGAPQRGFALLMVTQFAIGALGVALLPAAVLASGRGWLWGIFALAAAAMLALVPWLRLDSPADAPPPAAGSPRRPQRITPLAALTLFQAAHTAGAAFLLDIGGAAGLSLAGAQAMAGLGGALGAAGAALVVVTGRAWPGLRALVAIGTLATLPLFWPDPVTFAVGVALTALCWGMAVPLLLARCTAGGAADAAWTSFAAKLGLASGPMLAGLAATPGSARPALVVAIALSAAAGLLLVGPAAPRRGG